MGRLLLIALGTCSLGLGAVIEVYMAPPQAVTTPIIGATTETFNSATLGDRSDDYRSAIGTYDLRDNVREFRVQNSDQYGGAGGSRYMTFGAQNGVAADIPLRFSQPQDYFGFWWSAGDANNTLTFYSGTLILARFSTSDILAVLRKATGKVVAMDGTKYDTWQYFGKPGTGENTGEPYVYLSFVGRGARFDRVVLGNSGSTSTGFESDNHSVYRGTVLMPDSQILITTPEPGTLALGGAALMALGLVGRRKAPRV